MFQKSSSAIAVVGIDTGDDPFPGRIRSEIDHMKRRHFISLLGSATTWTLAARAAASAAGNRASHHWCTDSLSAQLCGAVGSKRVDGIYPASASTAERRGICSVIRENPVYTDSNSVVKENPVGKELPNDVTPKFLGGSRDRRLLDKQSLGH